MAECSHPSTHPPLPPTTEDDRLSWLRLLRSHRIGIQTFFRLLEKHGSAAAALEALPEMARASGLTTYQPCTEALAIKEMILARAAGATMLCYGAQDYPEDLYTIADPPPLLWAIGNLEALRRPRLAVAGARNASSLGLRMAASLAGQLDGEGYCITSGLARGIDTAAHKATLENGSIAVLAGGVDVVYPAENAGLADQMRETGLRLSDQPIGMAPRAQHFPKRNRIISGLARALVVIEAGAKSGSLITARAALDQGREVLAVPGHPFDARASGCNMLIRDGATLVRSAADVIEALPPQAQEEEARPKPQIRRQLYDLSAISAAPRAAPMAPALPLQRPAVPIGIAQDPAAISPLQNAAQAAPKSAPAVAAPHVAAPEPSTVPSTAHSAAQSTAPSTAHSTGQTIGQATAQTTAQTAPPSAAPLSEASTGHTAAPQGPAPSPPRSLRETASLHSEILGRLAPAPVAEDQLIRDIGVAAADVAPVLLELELDGQIERQSGGLLARR